MMLGEIDFGIAPLLALVQGLALAVKSRGCCVVIAG